MCFVALRCVVSIMQKRWCKKRRFSKIFKIKTLSSFIHLNIIINVIRFDFETVYGFSASRGKRIRFAPTTYIYIYRIPDVYRIERIFITRPRWIDGLDGNDVSFLTLYTYIEYIYIYIHTRVNRYIYIIYT